MNTEFSKPESIQSHQQGFTLVEILIAMAILAVLAAVAIPAYNGYIASARTTECRNNLSTIKLAEEEYFLENNRYFPDPDGTASTTAATLSTYWSAAESGTERNFAYSVTSSSTGTAYSATCTGRGAGFKVPATITFTISN